LFKFPHRRAELLSRLSALIHVVVELNVRLAAATRARYTCFEIDNSVRDMQMNECLGYARERGAERFGVLGDLVGYALVRVKLSRSSPATPWQAQWFSRATTTGPSKEGAVISTTRARAALQWARGTLTREQKDFLVSLPLKMRHETVCFRPCVGGGTETLGLHRQSGSRETNAHSASTSCAFPSVALSWDRN
jgi:hypothetical protein